MVVVENLNKKYGRKRVLKEISLKLENGVYGLIGPNGAGKTTLLRILAGVLEKNGGKIFSNDKLSIGYLPQKFGCFPEFTLYEQMEYFALLKKVSKERISDEIKRVLNVVNLSERRDSKCGKLSGGMIRRAGIAQALIGDPNLLLLDEPTVGLDPEERNNFNNIIYGLNEKMSVILSTHLVEDIKYLCKNIIIMKNGSLLNQMTAEELAEKANAKVWEVPQGKLSEIRQPFYKEKIYENGGLRMCRILLYQEADLSFWGNRCTPDIEDGYLILLKSED